MEISSLLKKINFFQLPGKEVDFSSFMSQVRSYLLLIIFLSTTLGILTTSYALVEAAFKTWIVLLAVKFIESSLADEQGNRLVLIFVVVVATVAFYLTHLSELSVGVVAYLFLIFLLIFVTSSPGNVLNVLLEILLPYYVITSFFCVTWLTHEGTVNTSVIVVTAIIVIAKVLSYVLGKSLVVEDYFSILIRSLSLLLNKRFLKNIKSRGKINVITCALKFLRFDIKILKIIVLVKPLINKIIKIADITDAAARQVSQKSTTFFRFLSGKFLVLEEKIGKTTYEITKLVERLQHAMEHSFMFFFFLMGLLVLIAILFYIVLTI